MIKFLAAPSFHATLFEKTLANKGIVLERVATPEEAVDADLLFAEGALIEDVQEDMVVVGINVPKARHQEFDLVVEYPIEWSTIAGLFPDLEEGLFDPAIRSDIEGLLGRAKYNEAIGELLIEVDKVTANFEDWSTEQQIAQVHRISGACAMLGLSVLHFELLATEARGKEGQHELFKTQFRNFSNRWPERREYIEREIA